MTNILTNKLLICISIFIQIASFAQRDLTPSKGSRRSSTFGGPQDFRSLKNYGLQVSAGATYQFTKLKNEVVKQEIQGRPSQYILDPQGKIGVFFDIGTAHFPLGESKFKFMKKRFISYYDWGLGFKLLGGKESVEITNFDGSGNIYSTSFGEGSFYNGYAFGRVAAHKNFYFAEKYFIDNALGLNIDGRVITGSKEYLGTKSPETATQSFHKPFVTQIHYDFSFGIKKRRGSYVIPGFQLPILGIIGGTKLHWFSSDYYPVLFKVKFIMLSEKKKSKTSCNEGSEEDRKMNKEYMQGQ